MRVGRNSRTKRVIADASVSRRHAVVQLQNGAPVAADRDSTRGVGGEQIALHSDRDGNDQIYVMNTDGSGQTRLTTHISAGDGRPAWQA